MTTPTRILLILLLITPLYGCTQALYFTNTKLPVSVEQCPSGYKVNIGMQVYDALDIKGAMYQLWVGPLQEIEDFSILYEGEIVVNCLQIGRVYNIDLAGELEIGITSRFAMQHTIENYLIRSSKNARIFTSK